MNSICLIGNICNDVELKVTQSGKNVCSFNLAVRRPFSKDTTDFFTVTCWGKQAESVSQYCKKGTRIGLSGMLTSRKYQDKDGNNRTSIEVVADEVTFVERKSSEGGAAQSVPSAPYNSDGVQFEEMTDDGELPF